ncbi:MAG: hypothetical protein ABH951_02650 [Patescibacteria group bacterium]
MDENMEKTGKFIKNIGEAAGVGRDLKENSGVEREYSEKEFLRDVDALKVVIDIDTKIKIAKRILEFLEKQKEDK